MKSINLIDHLNLEESEWLVRAVSNILMADATLDKDETKFVKSLCKVFVHANPDALKSIVENLKNRKFVELQDIAVKDAKKLKFMLDILSSAVFINGKKVESEREEFFKAGFCLGLKPGLLSLRLGLEVQSQSLNRKLEIFDKDLEKLC